MFVLSNGTIIFVNKGTVGHNSELADLWLALHGSVGANFGMVVELQMNVHATQQVKPNSTSIAGTGLAGQMCWSLIRSKENETKALQQYGKWMDTLPGEMTGAVIITAWDLPIIEFLHRQGYLSAKSADALSAVAAWSQQMETGILHYNYF